MTALPWQERKRITGKVQSTKTPLPMEDTMLASNCPAELKVW